MHTSGTGEIKKSSSGGNAAAESPSLSTFPKTTITTTHAAWSKVCRNPECGQSYSTVCTASSQSTVAPPTAAAPAAALAAAATRALWVHQQKREVREGKERATVGRSSLRLAFSSNVLGVLGMKGAEIATASSLPLPGGEQGKTKKLTNNSGINNDNQRQCLQLEDRDKQNSCCCCC